MVLQIDPIAEIHVDDVGTVLRIQFMRGGDVEPVDFATTREIVLRKPDGSAIVRAASFSSDGTDGLIEYVTVSGDVDQEGAWKIQGHVSNGSTVDLRSEVGCFLVHPNLPTS